MEAMLGSEGKYWAVSTYSRGRSVRLVGMGVCWEVAIQEATLMSPGNAPPMENKVCSELTRGAEGGG